jgi:hypothetical protein
MVRHQFDPEFSGIDSDFECSGPPSNPVQLNNVEDMPDAPRAGRNCCIPLDPVQFQATSTTCQLLPCALHVADNLQAKFHLGEPMRVMFKRAVYAFTPHEKHSILLEIQDMCVEAFNYIGDIDPEVLFRAHARMPRYNFYTNQPVECMNWVCRPARKNTRFSLMKSIEKWVINMSSDRLQFHSSRAVNHLGISHMQRA